MEISPKLREFMQAWNAALEDERDKLKTLEEAERIALMRDGFSNDGGAAAAAAAAFNSWSGASSKLKAATRRMMLQAALDAEWPPHAIRNKLGIDYDPDTGNADL